ncbi:MAG: hypothetical protein ACK5MK_12490 [Dysgonomonas sp.]
MNRKFNNIFCLIGVALSFFLWACDSGDIYPKDENYEKVYVSVSASFYFEGLNAFPEEYKILFVTYANSSDTEPLTYKEISKPNADGIISVSFPDIPEGTHGVGLWLVEKTGNKKMLSFYDNDFETTPTANVVLPSRNINLLTYARLQKQLFSQCIACHGGGASAAAGLYLTEGQSYSHLVNVVAKNNSSKVRVLPGSASGSFLMDVLNGFALTNIHSSLSSLKDEDVVLAKEWIEAGAKNE